jgi:hypothetical protein
MRYIHHSIDDQKFDFILEIKDLGIGHFEIKTRTRRGMRR